MVFGAGPLNTLKLFYGKMYTKNGFSYISRFFNNIVLDLSIKVIFTTRWFLQQGISISALKESLSLLKSKNKIFRHEKNPKRNKNIKKFHLKKILSDIVYQLLIIIVSWRCCDPSAHKDVFENYWFPTGFVVVWYTSSNIAIQFPVTL